MERDGRDSAPTTGSRDQYHVFYSTGIPVCVLVLKKCKKSDDVLFINASEAFDKNKRQNTLSNDHTNRIIETYRTRPKQLDQYARCVTLSEIEANDFNLNMSRYVSMSTESVSVDLSSNVDRLARIDEQARATTKAHNAFLQQLGLPPLPVR